MHCETVITRLTCRPDVDGQPRSAAVNKGVILLELLSKKGRLKKLEVSETASTPQKTSGHPRDLSSNCGCLLVVIATVNAGTRSSTDVIDATSQDKINVKFKAFALLLCAMCLSLLFCSCIQGTVM